MNHSGRVQDGCFVRKDMTAYGRGTLLNQGLSGQTIESCALSCSKQPQCDTFELKSSNRCFLKKGGKLKKNVRVTARGGICPKGKFRLFVKMGGIFNF